MQLRSKPLLLLALVFLASPATAQHKQEKHPEIGIERIDRPRRFDAIPTTPDEKYIQLKWIERAADPKRKSEKMRRFLPELYMVFIPRAKAGPTAPGERRTKSRSTKKVKFIDDLPSWVRHEFFGFEVMDPVPGYPSGDYKAESWSLMTPAKGKRESVIRGWAHTWQDDQHTIALVGRCAPEDMREMQALWEVTAKKMKLAPPRMSAADDRERVQLLRNYERSTYRGVDYRMKVREDMVKPWKAEDTENYIVVYNTKDQPLVRKILRDLEGLRDEYARQFPPIEEVTAVSTVRICKNKEEYIAYGGSPRTAGYWNYVTEELVLYDAEKQGGSAAARDAKTFVVLYHEAFHQYIFYSCGEVSPHSWFNEGFGDYFGGALLKGGKVKKIGTNPMRAWLVQTLAEGTPLYIGGLPKIEGLKTFEEMSHLPKSAYYSDPRGYATGWSMIYFLKSKTAQRNKQWAAILPTYFTTLQQAWQKELQHVSDPSNRLTRQPAAEAARKTALRAAFKGIDMNELNEAWIGFTRKLGVKRPK